MGIISFKILKIMLYIIDGYNVLFSERFKEYIEKFGFQSAREHLINFIKSYKANCLIVFDGNENYPNPNIKGVIFTKNEKADEYIKKFIKNYNKKHELIVVSDDSSIIDFAKKHNVKFISVEKFLESSKLRKQKNKKEIDFEKITEEIKKEWGI